jgi:pimeloyl-ACP methyl ester carboxylesterase
LNDVANRPQVGVLMVNTGGEHRIGTNRMYTRWARTWAAQGWACMRIDLPGLGNSPAREGEKACEIHLRQATEDIRAAALHLQTQHGVQQVHLIGLCSGAFHALTATFEGAPVRSVTAINQMVYFWQDKMPLAGEASEAVVVAIAQNVGRSLSDPQRWLKLLRGEVNARLIARALARRLKQRLVLASRTLARKLHWPLAHDLHTAMLQAANEGKHLHLIFSEGEPGLTLVHEQAGQAVRLLTARGQLALSSMPQTDHTFTQQLAQHRLFDVVDAGIRQAIGGTQKQQDPARQSLGPCKKEAPDDVQLT